MVVNQKFASVLFILKKMPVCYGHNLNMFFMVSKQRFEFSVGIARFSKLQYVCDFQNFQHHIEHFLWLKSVLFEISKKVAPVLNFC